MRASSFLTTSSTTDLRTTSSRNRILHQSKTMTSGLTLMGHQATELMTPTINENHTKPNRTSTLSVIKTANKLKKMRA